MDKNEFEEKIHPLGRFKRALKGISPLEPEAYEDLIFIPNPSTQVCGDCHRVVQNRKVVVEKKFRKHDTVWVKKCLVCKEKFTGLDLEL